MFRGEVKIVCKREGEFREGRRMNWSPRGSASREPERSPVEFGIRRNRWWTERKVPFLVGARLGQFRGLFSRRWRNENERRRMLFTGGKAGGSSACRGGARMGHGSALRR